VFEIRRGDDELLTGHVIHQIIADIAKAKLIIANIDGHNPNVMYELGIAHALSKPIIHLYPADQTLRFDIAAIRGMPYHLDDPIKLKAEGERLWKAAHANVMAPADNPVTASLGNDSYAKILERNNELELKTGFDQSTIKTLREELAQMKSLRDEAMRELTRLRTLPRPAPRLTHTPQASLATPLSSLFGTIAKEMNQAAKTATGDTGKKPAPEPASQQMLGDILAALNKTPSKSD
jgi:hypothetical protein